jgi:hypothetical protein
MMRQRSTLPALLLGAFAAVCPVQARLGAQLPAPTGVIRVNVTVVSASSGAPVPGATLRLRTVPEAAVVTDSLGRAAFIGVPKRMEGIEATHAEFEPVTEVLLLRDASIDEVSLTLPLRPLGATRLSTVAVTASAPSKAPGLEVRRAIGRGHLIDRREIDRVKPRATTDMLRRVAGLSVETQAGQVRVRSRRAGNCEMLLFLDGMPIHNEAIPGSRASRGSMPVVSVIDKIPPDMLEAVEVYLGPSQTPPQYTRVGQNCGTILLWTRSSR